MLRISSSSSSLHVPSICGAPVNFILSFLNPSSRKVSNFTRLALLHSTTLFPNSRNFQFPTFKRVSTMMGRTHSCSRVVTASYSAGSGPGGSSGGDREILVQHLLVKEDDQKLLLDLQKRTAEGEDLSDLAVEYSLCPSKEDGGMLGWVRKGQMVPEFEESAFGAPLNKVVKCKTKFGWHLLQVLSEREESVLEHIQPNEFHVRLQDPSFLEEAQLIDVREPEEVAQASVPGFQVLPLRQFGVWGPEITTKFDPQKDTYVLCHHGMRSLQVAKWLQTQVFVFLSSLRCKAYIGTVISHTLDEDGLLDLHLWTSRDSGKYLTWPEESMNMLSKLIHRSQLIEAGTLRVPALSPAPPPGDS